MHPLLLLGVPASLVLCMVEIRSRSRELLPMGLGVSHKRLFHA